MFPWYKESTCKLFSKSPAPKPSIYSCQRCLCLNNSRPLKQFFKNVSKNRVFQIAVGATTVFACYKLYAQKDGSTPNSPEETHKDPHCKGSTGVLVKHGHYWLPSELFREKGKLQKIKNFNGRDADVVVASFPKSGTTWLQEIIYLITNDLDLESAAKHTIEDRFPYIEYVYPGLRSLDKLQGRRLMKTHLPLDFLPQDLLSGRGKLVYIARNPKDVSVSLYHFLRMLSYVSYKGHFYDFYESFLEGKVPYGPWNTHTLQYWQSRERSNILFITYEDLHKKPKEVVEEIARFLGRDLTSEQVETIVHHCCFQNMRENPKVNYSWWREIGLSKPGTTPFMRKGKVGDWKNYYSTKMSKDVDGTLLQPLAEHGLTFLEEL